MEVKVLDLLFFMTYTFSVTGWRKKQLLFYPWGEITLKKFFVWVCAAWFCLLGCPAFAYGDMSVSLQGRMNVAFSLEDNKAFLSSNSTYKQSYVAPCFLNISDTTEAEWKDKTLYLDFGQPVKVSTWGLNAGYSDVLKNDGIVSFIFDEEEDGTCCMTPYNESKGDQGPLDWADTTCFGFGKSVTVRDENGSVLDTCSLSAVRNFDEGCVPALSYLPALSITSSNGVLQSITWKMVAPPEFEGTEDVDMPIEGNALTRDSTKNIYVSSVYRIRVDCKDGTRKTLDTDISFQDGDLLSFTEDFSAANVQLDNIYKIRVYYCENMPSSVETSGLSSAEDVSQNYRSEFYFFDRIDSSALTMDFKGEFDVCFSVPSNKTFLSSNPTYKQSYFAPCWVGIPNGTEAEWQSKTLYVDFSQPVEVGTWGLNAGGNNVKKEGGIVTFVFDEADDEFCWFGPKNDNTGEIGPLDWADTTCFGFGKTVSIWDELGTSFGTASLPALRSFSAGCIPALSYLPALSITSSNGILQSATWKMVAANITGETGDMDMPIEGDALKRDTAKNIYVSDVYQVRVYFLDDTGSIRISKSISFNDGDTLTFTEDFSSENITVSNINAIQVRWNEDMPSSAATSNVYAAAGDWQTYRANFYFVDQAAPSVTPTVTVTGIPKKDDDGLFGCNIGFAPLGALFFVLPLFVLLRK